MITATQTIQRDNQLRLEITYPERKTPVVKYFATKQKADLVLCRLYHAYIYKKLRAYLRQRSWCLQHDGGQVKKINTLLTLLDIHEKGTYGNICRFAYRHWDEFTAVAPGKKSKFHKHYITRIIPILNHCDEVGGLAQ